MLAASGRQSCGHGDADDIGHVDNDLAGWCYPGGAGARSGRPRRVRRSARVERCATIAAWSDRRARIGAALVLPALLHIHIHLHLHHHFHGPPFDYAGLAAAAAPAGSACPARASRC